MCCQSAAMSVGIPRDSPHRTCERLYAIAEGSMLTQDQRERVYMLVGVAYKALHCRATSVYMRLAYLGACPFCQTPFREGLDAVADALRHARTARGCCRALVEQVEQPAWEADQARLRRRAKSPYARMHRHRCERCAVAFVSVR